MKKNVSAKSNMNSSENVNFGTLIVLTIAIKQKNER